MTQEGELGFATGDSALTGLVLLIGGLALAPVAVAIARRVYPGRNLFFARWGFSHVGWVLLFGIFASVLIFGAARELMTGADEGTLNPFLVSMGGQVLLMAAVCTLIAVIAHRLDPDGVRCLGLRADRNPSAMFVGLVSYVFLFPALMGAAVIWPWLMERVELTYAPQAVAVQLMDLSGAGLVVGAIFAVVLLPLFEELVFRSFLQPLLVQNLGDRGGVVLTSVLFGLLHGASAFLPIFAFSLVLGFVMLRTQRLSAPWLVHAIHNGLMLALLILFPEAREMMGHEVQ